MGARTLNASIASVALSPSRVYANEPMTFYVNATSSLSSPTISITIFFDYFLSDGVTVNPESPVFSVDVSGKPANVTTTWTYDHIGNLSDSTGTYFQCMIFVSDGESTAARSPRAYVVENTAPWLERKPPATIFATYNLPYNMSFLVKDWDNELVTATWSFGDGTDAAVNETTGTPAGSYVNQTHTWVVPYEPGRPQYYALFNMSVSFVDFAGHARYSNHTVNITVPSNSGPTLSFTVASNLWSPGYDLPLYANVTDKEGDPITWTFIYNDSVENYLTEVYHTDYTDPLTVVWLNTTHTFSSVGTYYITLYVSDALIPYQVRAHNVSQTVQVTIMENNEPGVLANITVTSATSPPKINATLGYVEVAFSTQVRDPDGDVLYLTWDFADGEGASNTTLGGLFTYTVSQVHRYNVSGEYNVSLVVEDMRGHVVLRYKVITILSYNTGPVLRAFEIEMSHGVYATPESAVNLTMTIYDAERDPLTIWVDFGDNTSVVTLNLTEFSEDNTVSFLLSHVYHDIGTYNITVVYTDGHFGPTHNLTIGAEVEVRYPREYIVRVWDWWDYTSLSLLFLGIGFVFARWIFLGRFRNELDKKGMTLEQYNEIVSDLKAKKKAALRDVGSRVKTGQLDSSGAKTARSRIQEKYLQDRKDLRAGTYVEVHDGGD